MVQVTPVVRPKIVKKKVTKFKRHQSDRFLRVPVSSRLQMQPSTPPIQRTMLTGLAAAPCLTTGIMASPEGY